MSSQFSRLMQTEIIRVLIGKHNLLNKVSQDSRITTTINARQVIGALEGNINVLITEVPEDNVDDVTEAVSEVLASEYTNLIDPEVLRDYIIDGIKGNKSKSTKRLVNTNFTRRLAGKARSKVAEKGTRIQDAKGRFTSTITLRHTLEQAARKILAKNMMRSDAPLKYRSGRFANSLTISYFRSIDNDTVEISYDYMKRPYSVFDPKVSVYRQLSLRPSYGARNPRKLIPEAISQAVKELMHARYKILYRLL